MWFFLGYILLISLSLAAARNPRMAAVAGIFWTSMGFWMGSIFHLYETYYDGIVGQALIASVATFLAALALYASRAVRVTRRFVQVVMIAMVGLLFTYMVGSS